LTLGLTLFAAVGSADARPRLNKGRIHAGTTSQGRAAVFIVVRREGQPFALVGMAFMMTLTCEEDQTSQQWLAVAIWPSPLAMPSHGIDLNQVELTQAISVEGKIQAVHGSGSLSWTIPAFTAQEQIQTCSSGDLSWTVHRRKPTTPIPAPPAHPLATRVIHADGATITLSRVS